jgi:hypothetical protein
VRHQFSGIGDKSATLTMMLVAATPLNFLAIGFWGRITHWILSRLYMWLASNGLVLINVEVSKIQVAAQKSDWEAALKEAWAIVDNKTKDLSNAEKKKIDDRVRKAHRRFASFGARP